MKFLIISHVEHTQKDGKIYGYGPYVKEMNLWLKYVDSVRIVAPLKVAEPNPIDLSYEHKKILFDKVPAFNLLTISEKLKTLMYLPFIFFSILRAMIWAEHIHLRCPGNMGLLGTIAQIFFPWKMKTTKYAGNWDPNSEQPLTYRLQKKIISNTFLSKNMKVLVYGKWDNQSENIIDFFTASYKEEERVTVEPKSLEDEIKLVFVGALSYGKRPLIALQAVSKLVENGHKVSLDVMGEGLEMPSLKEYIIEKNLSSYVTLHGNKPAEFVKQKFISAHFLILMSKSEGWPKVVAEAMFWGCVPITSNVSCVNFMIGNGSRGTLVDADGAEVANAIEHYINVPTAFLTASSEAIQWSRQFTLESFEKEIKALL